jgi:RNA polymerase-binding transcription factor DksA
MARSGHGADQTDAGARLRAMRAELRTDLRSVVAVLAKDVEERVTDERTLATELYEIDDALRRLAQGTYGICVECGRTIAPARLEARPQAARCMECQRRHERRRN